MDANFQLIAVAFVRSAGGRVRVLFAVDRDGEQLFEGEPALLVEHRPGGDARTLAVEGADRVPAGTVRLVQQRSCLSFAELVDAACDEFGQLDGQRLLGSVVDLVAPECCFDE